MKINSKKIKEKINKTQKKKKTQKKNKKAIKDRLAGMVPFGRGRPANQNQANVYNNLHSKPFTIGIKYPDKTKKYKIKKKIKGFSGEDELDIYISDDDIISGFNDHDILYGLKDMSDHIINIQHQFYEDKLCKVEKDYYTFLHEISSDTHSQSLSTLNNNPKKIKIDKEVYKWFRKFKINPPIWQLYKKEDIINAYKIMANQYSPEHNYFVGYFKTQPKSIQNLLNTYIYKIITEYFTKLNIIQCVMNYDTLYHKWSGVNNLFYVLSSANIAVNEGIELNWNSCFNEKKWDRQTTFVHSGGNIFYLFANVLKYLYENYTTSSPLNFKGDSETSEENKNSESPLKNILNKLSKYKNLERVIINLYQDNEALIDSIGETISDIDMLLMSKDDTLYSFENMKKLNLLSSYINRNILHAGLYINDIITNKVQGTSNKRKIKEEHYEYTSDYKDHCSNLLPFGMGYDSTWNKGSFISSSGITKEEKEELENKFRFYDEIRKLPNGYRQTSSYISDIPIYINRIKYGYNGFNKIQESCEITDDYIKNKYGEGLDLVIGSITNELYNSKRTFYLNKNFYSIECLSHELEYINKSVKDDKSTKRDNRLKFLNIMKKDLPIFNMILYFISEELHNDNGKIRYHPNH